MQDDTPAGPAWAEDPVAGRTQWEPLVGGGTNFRTRNLVRVSPDRVEFPAARGMKFFAAAFGLVGLGVTVLGAASQEWVTLLLGLPFLGVGLVLLRTGTAPVVFDKRQGAFWKGRQAPNEVIRRSDLEYYTPLEAIHALQVLSEYVRGDKRSYWSYELNLVLSDGARLNVVDHGDYETLRANAEELSRFLDRPVWDAAQQH